MEVKIEKSVYKVVLIGDAAQKQNFTMKTKLGIDGLVDYYPVKIKSKIFQIWDTAVQEHYNSRTSSYLKDSDAIIFFGTDKPNFLNEIDANHCPIFDFNSFNLSPINFLVHLEDVILNHSQSIKLSKEQNKLAMHRSLFAFHPQIFFSSLPKEVKMIIADITYKAMKCNFFNNPEKPIYKSLTPKELLEKPNLQNPTQDENEEEQGFFCSLM